MTRWILLPFFAAACSAGAPPGEDDAGTPATDAAAADGATKPPLDAGADAAESTDANASDAASNPFVPHPAADMTKCGSGVVSEGSSQSACTEPSEILDYVLLDGGSTSYARACGALTVGAGEWQAWCDSTSVYLWTRMPFTSNGSLQDCKGNSLLMIDYGLYEAGSGGGNGVQVGTYETDGTEIAGTPPNDAQTIVASTTIASTAKSGAASVFVAGSLEDTCTQIPDPPTVLAGFDATWTQ